MQLHVNFKSTRAGTRAVSLIVASRARYAAKWAGSGQVRPATRVRGSGMILKEELEHIRFPCPLVMILADEARTVLTIKGCIKQRS